MSFGFAATRADSIRWQTSSDGGANWIDMGISLDTVHSIGVTRAMNGRLFRARLSNACGETVRSLPP
ncbi:MAG: hypothetical protein IPP94_10785 [Ignavibacteria bacterium]|nr:hypothetical protein [Ignavibacteria bacterium]